MNPTEKFLRDFNQAWADEDVARIAADVTDDIRFAMAGRPMIEGRTDFEAFLKSMTGHHSDIELIIHQILIDGDRAAVTGEMAMTDGGKHRRYAFCDVYQLHNGKVAELIAYVNKHQPEN